MATTHLALKLRYLASLTVHPLVLDDQALLCLSGESALCPLDYYGTMLLLASVSRLTIIAVRMFTSAVIRASLATQFSFGGRPCCGLKTERYRQVQSY